MIKKQLIKFIIFNIALISFSCNKKFDIDPKPIANFTMSNDTIISGENLTVSAIDSNANTYYYWNTDYDANYGSGRSKKGASFSFPVSVTGNYKIQLSAINSGGSDTTMKTFTVINKPLPVFSFSGIISTYSYKITKCEFYVNSYSSQSNLIKTITFSGLNNSENYNFSADINKFYSQTDPQSSFTLYAVIYYKYNATTTYNSYDYNSFYTNDPNPVINFSL